MKKKKRSVLVSCGEFNDEICLALQKMKLHAIAAANISVGINSLKYDTLIEAVICSPDQRTWGNSLQRLLRNVDRQSPDLNLLPRNSDYFVSPEDVLKQGDEFLKLCAEKRIPTIIYDTGSKMYRNIHWHQKDFGPIKVLSELFPRGIAEATIKLIQENHQGKFANARFPVLNADRTVQDPVKSWIEPLPKQTSHKLGYRARILRRRQMKKLAPKPRRHRRMPL